MLAHLAQQTQAHHASADGDRLAIMGKPSLERYRECLAKIFCFEAPVEQACHATSGLDRGLLRVHLKTDKLAADLEALGMPPLALRPLPAMHFDSAGEALGWMWVIHRNTLFHGLIYRYLASKLPEAMQAAGSYFSAFEGRAGALMRQLGDALDSAANRPSVSERIVRSANEAFRLQRQWYTCDVITPRRPPTERPTKEAA